MINSIGNVKSVKKMNKILYQCKDLIMALQFKADDEHLSYMKAQLLKFGVN